MKNKAIKILLVDDNPHFRRAIKEFLEKNPCFFIIGEATNGKELLEIIETGHPDITIMDVFMPVLDGIDASKIILQNSPNEKIIALTTHVGPVYTKLIKENGIKGCVFKENVHKEITEAIFTVMNNGYYFGGISSPLPPKIE